MTFFDGFRTKRQPLANGQHHRSLGQRPRYSILPFVLAEGHSHSRQTPIEYGLRPKLFKSQQSNLGRCPRLRCHEAFGQVWLEVAP